MTKKRKRKKKKKKKKKKAKTPKKKKKKKKGHISSLPVCSGEVGGGLDLISRGLAGLS